MATTAERINCVSLFNREGGADKQYTLWIEPSGDGFLIQTQWGPRGGWVQSACKTPAPVPMAKAQAVYDKLIKEKKAKGYVAGEDAPAFSQTEGAVDTGIRPMLLTPATEDDLQQFIEDDAWVGQEKLNGKRIMLKIENGKVTGVNRRGLECPIPEVISESLKTFESKAVLDGELIGDVYHAFDLLELVGDWRATRFGKRHDALLEHFAGLKNVRLVPRVFGMVEKTFLASDLRIRRKEGVVFKLLGGCYEPGRRENLKKAIAVKIKFYAEIAARVLGWHKAKKSIEVGAYDPETKKMVSIGWVTVPAKYEDQIKGGVGGMVRVRYLYATPGKQLYQAQLDPTADGSVLADTGLADPITSLKYEGKGEEDES